MRKKSLIRAMSTAVVGLLLWLSPSAISAQTKEGTSTEGKDFWVTFLRHDARDGDDKPIELSLSISAREECDVTLTNVYSGFDTTFHVAANSLKDFMLYTGTAKAGARSQDKALCYSFNSEKVDTSAIHVTATKDISLFAAAWKTKSFDASNVLPTTSLLSEYYIQAYTPNDHGNAPQGTHFAIIATEDSTVVDFVPTVNTYGMNMVKSGYYAGNYKYGDKKPFETLTTDTLMKGQVFYVWTGNGEGADYDLSGTYVKARNNKKIAVFMGNPHTNVPRFKNRDHLFEQALPTNYWGTSFAITSSVTRKRDKVLVMAKEDDTQVFINDSLVHTFNFATNPKRTFEFEIGEEALGERDNSDINFDGSWKDKTTDNTPIDALGNKLHLVKGTSCKLETSCPASVYLLMVSDQYDKNATGDPALVWINPLEQVINEITFATYRSSNTHYVNIITDSANVASMELDGVNIAADFAPINGDAAYCFARKNVSFASHTLKGKRGFIAHVYGYGDIESYAYSAGGATNPLEQYILINGEIFSADSDNQLCGLDSVQFSCDLNYEIEHIIWNFGDNTPEVKDTLVWDHFYDNSGTYDAFVVIERTSANMCKGQTALDTIPIKVLIEELRIKIDSLDEFICTKKGSFRAYYTNEMSGVLTNCYAEFSEDAKSQGFTDGYIITKPTYFEFAMPTTQDPLPAKPYTVNLILEGECTNDTVPISFVVNYAADSVLTQRWNDVLGVKNAEHNYLNKDFVKYQWYKDGVKMDADTASYIYLNSNTFDGSVNYYVRLTDNKGYELCACPYTFTDRTSENDQYNFGSSVVISQTFIPAGENMHVMVDVETDVNFWNVSGVKITEAKIPAGGGFIRVPIEEGMYLLEFLPEGKQSQRKTVKIYVK